MSADKTMAEATPTDASAGEGAGRDAIRFDGVTKQFGDAVAVSDLNLTVHKNEFFSLLGPSGCGKTTTLRMVAGFEQPTEGAVYLDGEAVDDVPPYQRNVNTVFQSYALFEHLDIEENVAFGLRRRKVPKDETKTRVEDALELVQLSGRERSKPAQLSGGQKQRVALARALVNKPKVLLLDEPLGALDLKLRKQMQVELKEIQREVGITFLYVTHDQEEALAMSDRIAVMDEGVVQQCGPPEEIYETPHKTFVAGFIGVSNLLPATVDGKGVKLASGEKCKAQLPDDVSEGDAVHCSVRPEKIFLGSQVDNDMVSLEGTIVERIYLGTTTQVIVDLGDNQRVISLEQNTDRSRADDRWEIGHKIKLGWYPEHALILH